MSTEYLQAAEFDEFLISEYFRLGSIDRVLKHHHYSLPVSYASYHRVLIKFGVVKSAGPNSKLSESLYILSLLANYKIPLEKIYRKFIPLSVKVSLNTIHRILHFVRLGLTRRQGVALLLESETEAGNFLVGNDISLNNSLLGNKGDISLPMGHSKTGEDAKQSILRVLQQEVFTNSVIKRIFPADLLPNHLRPLMFIDIADIKVAVYHIKINPQLTFSSFKLQNLHFAGKQELLGKKLRPGVRDILCAYSDIQAKSFEEVPSLVSELNQEILAFAKAHST